MTRFQRSVARLHPEPHGPVLGGGFLVAASGAADAGSGVLVTCTHVVGPAVPRERVWVQFPQVAGCPGSWGVLEAGSWRAADAEDVAFYLVEHVPAGIEALRLRPTSGRPGWPLRSFGFPEQAPG